MNKAAAAKALLKGDDKRCYECQYYSFDINDESPFSRCKLAEGSESDIIWFPTKGCGMWKYRYEKG